MFRLFMLGSLVVITALVVALVAVHTDRQIDSVAMHHHTSVNPTVAMPVPSDQTWYQIKELGLQFQLESSVAVMLGYEIQGKGKDVTAHFSLQTPHPDYSCWGRSGSLGSIHAVDIGDQEEAAYYTLLKKVEIGDQYFVYDKVDDPCPLSDDAVGFFQERDPHQILNDAFDATAKSLE